MEKGTYVVGEIVGISEREYNGKMYYSLGVIESEYENEFGQKEASLLKIDISFDQRAKMIPAMDGYKGQLVMVPVRFMAKDGKRGAWLSAFMPRDRYPSLIQQPVKKAS